MSAVLAAVTVVLAAAAPPGRGLPATATIANCVIFPINEAKVAAKEPGVLIEIKATEGQQVKEGSLLARIDDLDVREEYKVAWYNLQVAKEEAESTVNVRYAKASAAVAKAEYDRAIEANKGTIGTYPPTEIARLELTWKRTVLEIEKAEMEQRIAILKARVKEAEFAVAQEKVLRRQVLSPLDGEVVEVRPHKGEWVKPGDMIARIIRLDHLHIEGFLRSAEFKPSEVADRPVTLTVTMAPGQTETFSGKVNFVSPEVQTGGSFRVRAEVSNRQHGGQWLLRPGLTGEIVIRLK